MISTSEYLPRPGEFDPLGSESVGSPTTGEPAPGAVQAMPLTAEGGNWSIRELCRTGYWFCITCKRIAIPRGDIYLRCNHCKSEKLRYIKPV